MTDIFASKEQREFHVRMLICIAHIDGKLSSKEEEYIGTLANIYGINNNIIENEKMAIRGNPRESSEEILRLLKGSCDEKQKRCLLQDIISLACVNGRFSDSEITFVKKVVQQLGVEENVANQILDLNLQSMQASKLLAKILLIQD